MLQNYTQDFLYTYISNILNIVRYDIKENNMDLVLTSETIH